ncbi:MAG: DUF2079 domain-containing protein, partial [Candidatus Roizmanbacteria bacterium]|nr:DUF2079 domain-containing protein [Candidatus Roizmanbacteria bacterium]
RKILDGKKISILIIIFSLIMSYHKRMLPYSKDSRLTQYLTQSSEINSVRSWEKKLKDENISVSVSEALGPHFSQRKKVFRFSETYKYADYVLILRSNIYNDWLDKLKSIESYEKLKIDKNYNIIYTDNDFEVYKKI